MENYLPALHFYVLSSISIIFVHIKKNKNLIFLPFNQEEGKMTEGVCIFWKVGGSLSIKSFIFALT